MLKKFNSGKKGDLSDDFKEQERIKKNWERVKYDCLHWQSWRCVFRRVRLFKL